MFKQPLPIPLHPFFFQSLADEPRNLHCPAQTRYSLILDTRVLCPRMPTNRILLSTSQCGPILLLVEPVILVKCETQHSFWHLKESPLLFEKQHAPPLPEASYYSSFLPHFLVCNIYRNGKARALHRRLLPLEIPALSSGRGCLLIAFFYRNNRDIMAHLDITNMVLYHLCCRGSW